MNAPMALAADADPSVGHVFLSEPFLKVFLTVDRPWNEVVLRQRFFPMTEFAASYGAT